MEKTYGCVEEDENAKEENKDIDGEMEERCFKEMYPGDSRKWLLRDPTWSKSDPPVISTMKETYQYPMFDKTAVVGLPNLYNRYDAVLPTGSYGNVPKVCTMQAVGCENKSTAVSTRRRTDILKQKFLGEVVEELHREENKPPPVEEYCTEYDGNFNAAGFQVPENEHAPNTEGTQSFEMDSLHDILMENQSVLPMPESKHPLLPIQYKAQHLHF